MQNNKRLLPHFLMVRSGLLNPELIVLLATIAASCIPASVANMSKPMRIILPVFATVSMGVPVISKISQKYDLMKEETRLLLDHIEGFKDGIDDFSVYGTRFPKMTERVIQYASKQDDSMFQRIIEHPDFLQNTKIATDIVIGHLEKNPNDAAKVNPNQIDVSMVPPRLYNKIIQINPNLRTR